MTEEANMLKEIMDLAKKYGYTVSDFTLDDGRVEVGLSKPKEARE